jgi:hypothetical protein
MRRQSIQRDRITSVIRVALSARRGFTCRGHAIAVLRLSIITHRTTI